MHQANGASNPLTCADCGQAHEPDDNYCRQCGMYLAIERLPVAKPEAGAMAVRPAGLPVPAKRLATAVAVGTVIQLGAGLAGKFLAKRAASAALSSARKPASKAVAKRGEAAPAEGTIAVVTEALFVRRTWIQRG